MVCLESAFKSILHWIVLPFCELRLHKKFNFYFVIIGREEDSLRKKNEEYLLLNFPCDVRKNLRGIRLAEDKKSEDKKAEDKKSEDKKAEDKKAENKKAEDKKAENKKAEDKKVEEKTAEDKKADKIIAKFSVKDTSSIGCAEKQTAPNQKAPPPPEPLPLVEKQRDGAQSGQGTRPTHLPQAFYSITPPLNIECSVYVHKIHLKCLCSF